MPMLVRLARGVARPQTEQAVTGSLPEMGGLEPTPDGLVALGQGYFHQGVIMKPTSTRPKPTKRFPWPRAGMGRVSAVELVM